MRYVLLTCALVLIGTVTHAQQQGWYWNGRGWVYRGMSGDIPVIRPVPPPAYDIPRREPPYDYLREFHRWGGHPKPMCPEPHGRPYLVPCY